MTPPYYAAIFTSRRTEGENGYGDTARRMEELAAQQPGYLGMEHARGADGLGITISYWETPEYIAAWKAVAEHVDAQNRGKTGWYSEYRVRVCRVERDYSGAD